jgi:general stress protein 26
MDSINKQQPEDVIHDLRGAEALSKIKELVGKSKTCLFCTSLERGKPFETRPMAVQKLDDEGVFWFLSADDSHKNEQIKRDAHVQLLFQGSSYSDFMTVYGSAVISKDRAQIVELWEPILKDWFTGGVDDPRITVIAVRPREGYYWDTKHGRVVALAKRVIGAAIGTTLDDSVEGKLVP